MVKTLLLVFIHGFKGDDTTFGSFPSHICALLSHALPNLKIDFRVYPQFSTTGDLKACVARFRDWLTNQVVDLEVERGTKSPTIEPGVRVVVIGHSMGGIVGAEAVLGIVGEDAIEGAGSAVTDEEKEAEKLGKEEKERFDAKDKSTLMFPYVQGLLAFDTPYLGISPGVVAYGAESHWSKGKAWYEGAAGLFAGGIAAKSAEEANAETQTFAESQKKLASSDAVASSTSSEAPSSQETTKTSWQRWGKTALFASAGAAAAAAAGTTAYLKRNEITSLSSTSFGWVASHLEFVGCLARGEELQRRIDSVSKLRNSHEVGFANMYTMLGRGATAQSIVEGGESNPSKRTFCNLPKEKSVLRGAFVEAKNEKAENEVSAHMDMFVPKENPGYYDMGNQAKDLIASWISSEWVDAIDPGEDTIESMDVT